MPMFLILSSGTVLGIKTLKPLNPSWPQKTLPPVMREGLVGLGHAVDIIPLLDRAAAQIRGVVQLVRQLFRHPLFRPAARVGNDPADRQAGPPVLRNFDRHLVVGARSAPR